MKASILKIIVVFLGIGFLFVNGLEPVFANEMQMDSELTSIQNYVGTFDEKSFSEKSVSKSVFDIISIGKTIDDKILEICNPTVLTSLINLSEEYIQKSSSFLENLSSELENNNGSYFQKKLVAEATLFVINTDLSVNKKLENIRNENFVKDELKRLDSETKFQKIHGETVIEDSKFGDLRDPLIDTIVKVTESRDYDLVIVGLKKLDEKTENYDDGTIQSSIDNSLKLFYELQSVNEQINAEKEKLREELAEKNYQEGYHVDLDWSDLEDLKLLQIQIINQLEFGVIDVIQNVDKQKIKVDEEIKLKFIQEERRDRKSNEYDVDNSETDDSKNNNNKNKDKDNNNNKDKDKDKKDKDN